MRQTTLFETDKIDMLAFERKAMLDGYFAIAGVDEAGRGPLAGPVVAAAVILPPGVSIDGVNDSKKLSPGRREHLYEIIIEKSLSVGIGETSHETIDRVNILEATKLAMLAAVDRLSPTPDCILIDGITRIDHTARQKTIKKGDSLSLSIAAASIIAKVTRDRIMTAFDAIYPGYGFAIHKGYPSPSHIESVRKLGPSAIHRLSFRGVREHVRCHSF